MHGAVWGGARGEAPQVGAQELFRRRNAGMLRAAAESRFREALPLRQNMSAGPCKLGHADCALFQATTKRVAWEWHTAAASNPLHIQQEQNQSVALAAGVVKITTALRLE